MSLPKKDLTKFINSVADNWNSVGTKLGKQHAGGRLYPSRTPKNDAASKARLDQGEKLPKTVNSDQDEGNDRYNVNVQANNQGPASHKKLFTVEVKPNDTKEAVKAKLESAARAQGLI
jgi:hypothetical protein